MARVFAIDGSTFTAEDRIFDAQSLLQPQVAKQPLVHLPKTCSSNDCVKGGWSEGSGMKPIKEDKNFSLSFEFANIFGVLAVI